MSVLYLHRSMWCKHLKSMFGCKGDETLAQTPHESRKHLYTDMPKALRDLLIFFFFCAFARL